MKQSNIKDIKIKTRSLSFTYFQQYKEKYLVAFVAKNMNSKSECIRYLRLFKFASFENVKSFTRQFDKNETNYAHVPVPKTRTKRPSSDSVKVFTTLFFV